MAQIPESANKGLEGIIACTTEVSTIHDVTLLYRGYTIEDLAAHCGFEEVVYLLWNGDLPNRSQLESFKQELGSHFALPSEMLPIIEASSKTNAHSMAKLRTIVSFFGQLDAKAEDITPAGIKSKAARLTGAFGSLVAAQSRFEQGQKP